MPHHLLDTLNAISSPLISQSSIHLPPQLIVHHPSQSISQLDSLLNLLQLCRSHPSTRPTTHLLRLVEILLRSLAPTILSYPRSILIRHPIDPILRSLISSLEPPSPIDHDHHPIAPSAIVYDQLASILRHLSPSNARRLAFQSIDPPQPPHPLIPSSRATAIITHILLTPGASAIGSDPQLSSPPSNVLTRIISFALSQPSNSNFILHLILAAIDLGHTATSTTTHLKPKNEPDRERSIRVDDEEEEGEEEEGEEEEGGGGGGAEELEQDSLHDKLSWKALLAGGRLAELIRSALDSPILKHRNHDLLSIPELESLSQRLILPRSTTLPQPPPPNLETWNGDVIMETNTNPSDDGPSRLTTRHQVWFALLSSLRSNGLIGADQVERIESSQRSDSIPRSPWVWGHHGDLQLGLQPLIESLGQTKLTPISELGLKLQEAILKATHCFHLSTCISLTQALSSLDTLSTIFLWIEPRNILGPVSKLLDRWQDVRNHHNSSGSDSDENSNGTEFAKFGCLLGWLQGVAGRFGFMSNLAFHLGTTKGFTIHYLSNPSTSYPISSLPSSHVTTLASWIEALYGSSGIPDDLLSNTDPRIFFTISASLFKQSFDALRIGLIDLQTFRDGLSYFEHDFLIVGCAVGVVGWLLDELNRVGPISATSYPTALLEILQTILLSDSIPATAIHLVSAKSLSLLRSFHSSFSSAQSDHLSLGSSDLSRRVQIDLTKIERKLTTLASSDLITPTGFLSDDFGPVAKMSKGGRGWEEAYEAAIRMAVVVESSSSDQGAKGQPTVALWSLLPHILKVFSIQEFIKMTISGIISAIRIDEEDHDGMGWWDARRSPKDRKTRVGARVEKAWDALKYERVERAIGLAADILTWPYDQYSIRPREKDEEEGILRVMCPKEGVRSDRANERDLPLVSRVLKEAFLGWAVRIDGFERIEDAEIERDIILECLDRLETLEMACQSNSDTPSTGDSRRLDQVVASPTDRSNHRDYTQDDDNPHQVNHPHPQCPITDFFRRVCFQVLRLQRERHDPRLGPSKRKRRQSREDRKQPNPTALDREVKDGMRGPEGVKEGDEDVGGSENPEKSEPEEHPHRGGDGKMTRGQGSAMATCNDESPPNLKRLEFFCRSREPHDRPVEIERSDEYDEDDRMLRKRGRGDHHRGYRFNSDWILESLTPIEGRLAPSHPRSLPPPLLFPGDPPPVVSSSDE